MIIPLYENMTIRELKRMINFYAIEYPNQRIQLGYTAEGIQLIIKEMKLK